MNVAFDAATENGAQVGMGRHYREAAVQAQRRAGKQKQQQQPDLKQGSVADFASAPWNIGAAGQQASLALTACCSSTA